MYVNQEGSFDSMTLLARALLANPDGRVDVYPAGEATIIPRATITFDGPAGEPDVITYEIYGLAMTPPVRRPRPEWSSFRRREPGFLYGA